MNDQARILRQLVRQESCPGEERTDGPMVIAVAAGKGGVGVTTVAVNLALALQQSGGPTVLVDGTTSADATTLCGLDGDGTAAQVAAGWHTFEESLVEGPGGIRLLPGGWSHSSDDASSDGAQARLIEDMRRLKSGAKFIVIDAGCGLGRIVGRFWRAADLVLVVATPEPMSIMDAYAAIKIHGEGAATEVVSLVNQTGDIQSADDVHARLARACQRFLALALSEGGYLPTITRHEPPTLDDALFVLHAPDATATLCIQRLANTIIGRAGRSAPSPHKRLMTSAA
jgi:flagellar biosynthesis protein FlhG